MACDFKFGAQLGFAKAHHKITSVGKSGGGLELGKLPKSLGFPYNISATASDFKFGTQLGFANDHYKITPIGKVSYMKNYNLKKLVKINLFLITGKDNVVCAAFKLRTIFILQ